VGDNTGVAVEELQLNPEYGISIIQEGHDSIIQEVQINDFGRQTETSTIISNGSDKFSPNSAGLDRLLLALNRTVESFDRSITFYNGITINIPIEAELSWNFGRSVKIKTLDRAGIEEALRILGPRT
jgi:hypothetical protein